MFVASAVASVVVKQQPAVSLQFKISISLANSYSVRMSTSTSVITEQRKGNKTSGHFSPPTYSVESDIHGNLYSRKYGELWPKRPKDGKHSVQTEMELRIATGKSREKEQAADADHERKKPKTIGQYQLVVCASEEPTVYEVRVMSMKHATRNFDQYQRRNLLIYYRIPEGRVRINDLQTAIPLMFACKDARNQICHHQIKCYTSRDDDAGKEDLWCAVKLNEVAVPEKELRRIGFTTMKALLEYWCMRNSDCPLSNATV